MRLTQSLFSPERLRLLCFVDDPIAGICGTPMERKLSIAVIILTWEDLGFTLAYRKGQRAQSVTWIGGTLSIIPEGIRGAVKQEIVDDIVQSLNEYSVRNVVGKKELHTFVGRVNFAAGLLISVRPFLHAIWAALYSKEGNSPPNTVWIRQIAHALSWLRAFFCSNIDGFTRDFRLIEYIGGGDVIEIGTDASPWGLGGWLSINGKITRHFSDSITSYDESLFGVKIGSPVGQQIWECLAVLVALKLWAASFLQQRMSLQVRGDNVGALVLLIKMRPKTAQLAIIAREMALCLASASFPPRVVHTPGIAHKVADMLSRVHQHTAIQLAVSEHPALQFSTQDVAPKREPSFYQTMASFGSAS
jgi:hypothetical protein